MDLNLMHPIIMRNIFDEAKGGVLFVDEAYALCNPTPVATFIQEMENHRDEVIVIMAGYNERMEAFLKANEGLKSRIPHWIDFPDYNADELTEIFLLMTKERNFTVKDDATFIVNNGEGTLQSQAAQTKEAACFSITADKNEEGHFAIVNADCPADDQAIDQTNHKSEIINHKYIKNGQLIIVRDGVEYNAFGTKL